MRHRLFAVVGAVLFVSACGAGQPVGSSSPSGSPPIDGSIAQVHLSNLSPDEALVLDACGLVYSRPGNNGHGLGTAIVTGMGLVAHARDIVNYAAIGPQPDIQTDSSAWVVTTAGWITVGLSDAASGIESKDPTC